MGPESLIAPSAIRQELGIATLRDDGTAGFATSGRGWWWEDGKHTVQVMKGDAREAGERGGEAWEERTSAG